MSTSESANPTAAAIDSDRDGLSEHFHKNRAGEWLTTFAPPPHFEGYENCPFNALTWYERSCTAEEIALIEAHEAVQAAAIKAEEEEDIAFAHTHREEWLTAFKARLGLQSPSLVEEDEGEDPRAGFPLSRE